MATIIGCTTTRSIWLTLEATFSNSSKSREIRLKEDLQSMKRGSRSVPEYSRQFKCICDQLAAIGKPIDDTDKAHWFLHGLGPQFTTFSITHMSSCPFPSFTDLMNRAEHMEIFKGTLDSAAPLSTAYYVNTRGGFQSRGGQNHGRGYSGGSGVGQNSGVSRNYSNEPLKCQICKKDGHIASRCRFRYARPGSNSRRPSQPRQSTHLAEAFNTSCSLAHSDTPDWFMDTGASAHMTSQASHLDQIAPYSESSD